MAEVGSARKARASRFETAQDVDAIAERIKSKGWTLTKEPADMPWGVRMLRVVDPDGYRLGIWRPLSA